MAEKESNVFVVATANEIAELPPELVRKGRFDEIFFVDLPDKATRGKILEIHLQARDKNPVFFDIDAIAAATEGFSGAEIEQVVVASLYAAHAARHSLVTQFLLEEAARTRPLSVVMQERIEALRAWAADRTVPCD